MKSVSSVFPLVLIVTGCTQHVQSTVEWKTIPDSYVLQFIVRDPLATKASEFLVSIELPRDEHLMKLGSYLNEERARTMHEF